MNKWGVILIPTQTYFVYICVTFSQDTAYIFDYDQCTLPWVGSDSPHRRLANLK